MPSQNKQRIVAKNFSVDEFRDRSFLFEVFGHKGRYEVRIRIMSVCKTTSITHRITSLQPEKGRNQLIC